MNTIVLTQKQIEQIKLINKQQTVKQKQAIDACVTTWARNS